MQGKYVSLFATHPTLVNCPSQHLLAPANGITPEPDYDKVPMVAVTGFSMYDDRRRSLEAGLSAHLTKPIEPRALLDLIEHL